MGGVDKGLVTLAGRRLIDHVMERFHPQVDVLLMAGRHDYGLDAPFVVDRDDGPAGPAAALWATLRWIRDNAPDIEGFVTAPVDAPFLPLTLAASLSARGGSAVAYADDYVQPTFAYWRTQSLKDWFDQHRNLEAPSLRGIASGVAAAHVTFDDSGAFANINSPADLEAAERHLADGR